MLTEELQDIRFPAPPATNGGVVDLCANHLYVASQSTLRTYGLNEWELREQGATELPFAVDRVWVSPSGRFAIVRCVDQRRLAVWDFKRARVSLSLETADPHRQPSIATFVTRGGEEIALCGRKGSVLEAYTAESGQLQWSADCETFRFDRLVPFDGPGMVVAVGFFAGETKNSLAVVDLEAAASRPQDVFDQFRTKTGVTDYAYRLDAGPAGPRSFVAFRDPEDDEDETSPDDEHDRYLHGYTGLYIRDVDGVPCERVEWTPADLSLGALAAGTRWIAVQGRNVIHLVGRTATSIVRDEPGHWLAADRDGSHLLIAQGSEWRLVKL